MHPCWGRSTVYIVPCSITGTINPILKYYKSEEIRHLLLDRDGTVRRVQNLLEAQSVPAHHDAYDPLVVGNEQHHRDGMLQRYFREAAAARQSNK